MGMNPTPLTVFYNSDYTASAYAFDTTRKSGVVAAGTVARGLAEVVDPGSSERAARDLIAELHEPAYVRAVRTGEPHHLASSQGFTWDEGIFPMAVAHVSGVVAAVGHVLDGTATTAGTLSSGLHHARAEEGRGYCTFNGLAVGAIGALHRGCERVLVLDFDAHCGGGTRSLLPVGPVVQVDVSTNAFDSYRPIHPDDLLVVTGAAAYDEEIDRALAHATSLGAFDLVLYNAGVDPSDSGVTAGQLDRRDRRVCEWAGAAGMPLVFTLAGGYTHGRTMDELADLHLQTVAAAADLAASR